MELVKHYSNTPEAETLCGEVLAGGHARAGWREVPRGPLATEKLPEAVCTDLAGLHVSLTALRSGEFMLMVSDSVRHPESTAILVYHLTLNEATNILGRSQRQWLTESYRAAIDEKLNFASLSMGGRRHRDAREYMAEAQEMSCALQALEGDSTDGVRTVRIGPKNGRHLHLVVKPFEGASFAS
jgi:hypothetical protein